MLQIVALNFLLCCLSAASVIPITLLKSGLFLSVQLSFLLFGLSAVSDFIVCYTIFSSDPVYNFRRLAALSMLSNVLWLCPLWIGSLLTMVVSSARLWVYFFLIGFSAVCILRMIVFLSTSFMPYWKSLLSSITQPILYLSPLLFTSVSIGVSFNLGALSLFLGLSVLASVVSATTLTCSVNTIGVKNLGIPTMSILKAFLANWMEDIEIYVERIFEKFGTRQVINYSMIAFESADRLTSLVVVPSFHPGPFRNVGSSMLPFLIQNAVEKRFGCTVAVPHGLFGHELDLASQEQNQKVLNRIMDTIAFSEYSEKVTPFVRVERDFASASCQIFGQCAVVSLSLAPETTEDFPEEVGAYILETASKFNLEHIVVINSHNAIRSGFDVAKVVNPLKDVALAALEEASKQETSEFQAGSMRISPREFSLEQGMGAGGISVLVIRTGDQTAAYITIDANNMVSGLREKILDAVKDLGVDIGEVFTTDTHSVNAIVMTRRGYHPLGEAIPHEQLISYCKEAVKKALLNMKSSRTSWYTGQVADVCVIGEQQIEELASLADEARKRARRVAFPLFAVTGVVLAFLTTLL
jgi:putative membrane protein